MSEYDERLQRKLSELESGTPLDKALEGLPEDEAAMLKLAAAMRAMPHPQPVLAQARFAREKTVPVARRAAPKNGMPRWLPLGLAGGFAALALVAVLAVAAFVITGNVSAKAATLMDVSGQVQVASTNIGNDWHAARSGEKIHEGARIRTGDGASVTLVFYEGSRSSVQQNADVTLARLDPGAGGVIHVAFNQRLGKTDHSVVPFNGKKSTFLVQTPSGTANVHGTRFDVSVGSGGQSRFAVSTGRVLVANPVSDVVLTAGQATAGLPGLALDEAAYDFVVQGELTAKGESEWTVAGVTFTVNAATVISGDPQLGSLVKVEGRIVEGARVADTIAPAENEDEFATYSGVLENTEGDTWQIGGIAFLVNGQTELGEGLVQGATVKVTYSILEGGALQAWSIEALTPEDPEVTPTTPVSGTPELSFAPDEVEVKACEATATFSGKLVNESTESAAANVKLDFAYVKGAEYIQSLTVTPETLASIAAGETVEFKVDLALTPEWLKAPAESEIKVRVFVAGADNAPEGGFESRLTLTVSSTCDSTATETPTGSVTPTETPTGEEGACVGAEPHPVGTRLAEQYGVPYEEIMGWFCSEPHFGFGEIDLAYSLAKDTGQPVDTIFAMKSGGMGWGNIKKELQIAPKPPSEDETTIGNGKSNNGNGNGNANKDKPTKKPKKK